MLSHVNKPSSEIVGPNDTFPQAAHKVVENARQRGWLHDLLRGALSEAGGNALLRRFISENPEYNPASPDEQVTEINHALLKTQEMLEGDLIVFSNTFQNTLEKIDILSDYKTLHDELHDITFGIFPQMQSESALLPDSDAKNDLDNFDKNFRSRLNRMREVVGRNKVSPDESEWIDELDAQRLGLKGAIRDYDKDRVRSHLQGIENVLQVRPSKLNKKLLTAIHVENDRLPDLVKIMQRVLEAMRGIMSEAANVPRFEKAITSLEGLTSQLKFLIEEHDTWQEVEGELKQTGEWLDANLTRFSKKWESIRARIRHYYSGEEEWATDFQRHDAALEDALRRATEKDASAEAVAAASADAGKMFELYCNDAKWRFFEVDKMLLNKCQTLTEIRKDLP